MLRNLRTTVTKMSRLADMSEVAHENWNADQVLDVSDVTSLVSIILAQ